MASLFAGPWLGHGRLQQPRAGRFAPGCWRCGGSGVARIAAAPHPGALRTRLHRAVRPRLRQHRTQRAPLPADLQQCLLGLRAARPRPGHRARPLRPRGCSASERRSAKASHAILFRLSVPGGGVLWIRMGACCLACQAGSLRSGVIGTADVYGSALSLSLAGLFLRRACVDESGVSGKSRTGLNTTAKRMMLMNANIIQSTGRLDHAPRHTPF